MYPMILVKMPWNWVKVCVVVQLKFQSSEIIQSGDCIFDLWRIISFNNHVIKVGGGGGDHS